MGTEYAPQSTLSRIIEGSGQFKVKSEREGIESLQKFKHTHKIVSFFRRKKISNKNSWFTVGSTFIWDEKTEQKGFMLHLATNMPNSCISIMFVIPTKMILADLAVSKNV